MARTIEKLKALQVGREKRPGYYSDGAGLYLQISPAGSKSWIFRYRMKGHLSSKGKPLAREMGLGSFADISLAEAREKARDARRQIADGLDPIGTKRAVGAAAGATLPQSLTFEQAATKYISSHRAGWKNPKHADQWESTLTNLAGPFIGAKSVREIDTALVLQVLEPIWLKTPETAGRVRGRIEIVLDWARVQGFREGENPARWRGHLDKLLPKKSKVRAVKHHAAMPFDDVPIFVQRLRKHEGVGALALEFTILTAGRTNETVGAYPSEIDEVQRAWTIPGERMKAGREHRVPLCDRAMEIIRILHPLHEAGAKFLFPAPGGDRQLSNAAMAAVLDRMNITNATVHGFRSSFRDWAS